MERKNNNIFQIDQDMLSMYLNIPGGSGAFVPGLQEEEQNSDMYMNSFGF
jgi:hypothetical protein